MPEIDLRADYPPDILYMRKRVSKYLMIFFAVFFIGAFLRVYHFSDFLRFNPDQSRDAELVRNVLSGKEAWPLLGPKAGGTEFRLGPAFYHFQILSAKIFGIVPDKMAFPDLLASVLSIPLLYIFLRKYFDRKISLASTAIFAVSFYAVKYSRFAWNPNSAPFYVLLFLYSLWELTRSEQKRRWLWTIILGTAAGIGVQLHSLLLFSFPIVFILYLGYLAFKKNPAWRWAPLVVLIAFLINAPQFYSEFQTGGKNVQGFFKGMENKSSRQGGMVYKLALDAVCQIQGNSYMILPFGNDSQCDFMDAAKHIGKNSGIENIIFMGDIIFAIVFSFGGYYLLIRSWRVEKNTDKKNLLGLVLTYVAVLFVILIPLAGEISFRFYLAAEFVPFLFLGLWFKFLFEHFGKEKIGISAAAIAATVAGVLIAANLAAGMTYFSYLSGQRAVGPNGFEEITLGEVKYMADFIEKHSQSGQKAYLSGKAGELFEITKSVQYYTNPAGIDVNNLKKDQALKPGEKAYFIDVVSDPKTGDGTDGSKLLDSGRYARVRIYELAPK